MKTTNILIKLLLLFFVLGGVNAWAVTEITSSPAPSGGKFSPDTHWYTIVYRGNTYGGSYLNVDQNSDGELTWGGALGEGAYWCFVGDNTNGFKMYNLKSGTTMVLQAVSTADDEHVKMVAADTANESLSLFTTGAMTANEKTDYNYIRCGTSGNAGLNQHGSYVGMYTRNASGGMAAGANFAVEITPATPPYRVIIKGDNNYTVTTTAAVKSGSQTAQNGGYLDLTEAPNLKDLTSFTIDCTDKFVWGPVVDNTAKTITYTVKEPVADVANLTEGFYQLEIVEASQDANFKTRLANILKTTTVNVKSNNYYVMPWYDNSSYLLNNQVYKYSGVYVDGHAPASFVYLKRDASDNLHFQSINGHYSTRPDQAGRGDSYIASANYRIVDNKFSIKGWVKQAYWSDNASSGAEGPHEAYDDRNWYESYYAAKADLSDYNVYKVDFENWAQGGSVKADPTATFTGSATCYGLPTVYRNGYFFFPKDYTPDAADFRVNGVSYTKMAVEVSAEADANGIYTLTFGETPTNWTVNINGGYKVSYKGGASKGNGEIIAAADNVAAIDLTVNCIDMFVWGPVIDREHKTITFDVRDAANSFTVGRWYQLQMLEKNGKPHNGSSWIAENINLVNAANGMNMRTKGSYIYLLDGQKTSSWTLEFSGYPASTYEPTRTYFYVSKVDGNNVQLCMNNGYKVTNNGQATGTASASMPLVYQDATNSFKWNNNVTLWGGLVDGYLGVGQAGAANTGDLEFLAHPVKSGEDYDMYKVVLAEHSESQITYSGSSEIIVATGGVLDTVHKTFTNGDVLFLPKNSAEPSLTDFTIPEHAKYVVSVDKSTDIWTLTFEAPPSYPLQSSEYTLTPADGSKALESISEVRIVFNLQEGKTVQSASEKNGRFEHSELPYLLSEENTTYTATSVTKNSDGDYTFTFSSAVTAEDYYTLFVPEGAFYVANSGSGEELPAHEVTATYVVGNPQEWFTIKNTRSNKYVSVSASGLTATEELKWGQATATTAGEYWQMVEDGDNGFYLKNKAYGPDYVLGMESTDDNARLRMYHKSEAVSANCHFDKVVSNQGGFSIVQHGHNNIGLHDKSSELKIWNGNNVNDRGSNFDFARVSSAEIKACADYKVYRISTPAGYDNVIDYVGADANVIGLKSVQDGHYIVLKYDASIEANQFHLKEAGQLAVAHTEGGDSAPARLDFSEGLVLKDGVTLQFHDLQGNDLPGAVVIYVKEDKTEVELSSTTSPYNFGGRQYRPGFFKGKGIYALDALRYEEATKTLTFILDTDVNRLQFSDAPLDGVWANNTKWFTWRNNRSNIASQWQLKYLTTSALGMRDDLTMYIEDLGRDVVPTDAGGLWCYAGSAGQFRIYNSAYGPDFCFVRLSNGKYTMVPTDDIPNGAQQYFSVETSNVNGGGTRGYQIRVGTSGNTFMHINNSDMTTYGASTTDTGNSFKFTYTDNTYAPCDVYKVEWGMRNKDVTSITYSGSGVFGKRGTPSDGAYMIFIHDTELAATNFTDNTSHAMANVSSRAVSGHAYRLLVLDMKRPIKVTLPQSSYTMTMGASMEVPAYKVTDNDVDPQPLIEGVQTTVTYASNKTGVLTVDGHSMRGVSAGSASLSVTNLTFNDLGNQYYYTDSSSFTGATANVTVTDGVMTVRFTEPSIMLVTKPDNTADVKQSGRVNFTGTDAITQLVIEPAAAASGATITGVSASVDDKITISGIDTNTVTLSSKLGVAADLTLTFTIASTGYNNQEATLKVRVLDNSNIVTAKEALTLMGNKPVGSGLGRYTYEGDNYDGKSGNEAYNAAYATFTNYCKDIYSQTDAEIDKRCDEINTFCTDLNSHLILNMPVAGKTLLRVRSSVEGKQNYVHVLGNATTGTIPSMNDTKNGTSIWYLHTDGRLYGYESGQATTGSTVAAVEAGDVLTIGQADGTLYSIYKDSNYWTANVAGNALTVDGDANAAAARWILEDVTELPVTIGTTGYATLCSPVALTVPYGVEAYVDVQREDANTDGIALIKLQKLNGVIPANTAVVLRAAEAKTYNFRVTSSSDDIEINTAKDNDGWTNNVVMQGTYPKLAADSKKTRYTLQKKSGEINFYPNNSEADLKPFRVFIPTVPAQSGQNVQMFMMDFGGGLTTDLDTVLGTTSVGATSPAFDLSGRLVQPTQRGLYLQQGRKVLRK